MIRPASMILIAFATVGCGDRSGEEAGDASPGLAQQAAASAGASVQFRGKVYDLTVAGQCGPVESGRFRVWAVTPGSDGAPLPDAPHLLALADDDWSVVDFYPGQGEEVVRIYRDGAQKLGFEDGVLDFDGELGAGLTEKASVTIECPQ